MPRKAVSKRPSEPAGRDPMEQLVSSFFQIIGEDESREGLVETPARVRLACDEVFAGYQSVWRLHRQRDSMFPFPPFC